MSQQVKLFKSTFNRLTGANMALLDDLYASNVLFTDPFHHIEGLAALRAYFSRQYEGVIRCTFTFEEQVVQHGTAMLTWTMHLEHARISKGETIRIPGASHIRFADKVTYHRDYFDAGEFLYERIPVLGVVVRTFKDHVVFEAEEVRGATGEPMQRYSAYRARWWTKWQATKPSIPPIPRTLTASKAAALPAPRPLPSAVALGYDLVTPWIQPGERRAQKRLAWFLEGPIHQYVDGRNRPAVDGSSKLSAHFRFGTLSPRVAVHAALGALTKGGRVSRPDVLTWIDEVIWREFFQQVLTAFPRVADGPFRSAMVPPSRQAGPERDRFFQAWCHGKTGYPIVDAGMRQLNQTGWMHNCVRMIVASFLIKDLRIDWQSGERYFMHHLLDADVAANNGNWQWCASTGTDAMRGYRIFNPALQSKKFDPEGAYIREYVPELARVASTSIHEPHLMATDEQVRSGCRIGLDYPAAIVDHRQARQEYLDLGKQQVTR